MLTGPELRRLREAAGLMRRELAQLLGLEVAVVKMAEAGRVGLVGATAILTTIMREKYHGDDDATQSA